MGVLRSRCHRDPALQVQGGADRHVGHARGVTQALSVGDLYTPLLTVVVPE